MRLKKTIDLSSPVNRLAPLNRGLVLWASVLPGYFGGNRWLDLCGKYHGTLTNMGPSDWVGNRPSGQLGSLQTDGTSKEAQFGIVTELASATNATLAAWAKRDSTTGLWVGQRGPYTTDTYRFGFAWASTSIVYFSAEAGSSSYPNCPITNEWHHVVMSYDGSQGTDATRLVVHIDGIQKTLTAGGAAIAAALPATGNQSYVTFGRDKSNRYASGNCSDIRVYNRTLSATEVMALYQASATGYKSELNWIGPILGVKAGPPATFQSAWARNSNVLIGGMA